MGYYIVADESEGLVLVKATDPREAEDLVYGSYAYEENRLSGDLKASRISYKEALDIARRDNSVGDLESGRAIPVLRSGP